MVWQKPGKEKTDRNCSLFFKIPWKKTKQKNREQLQQQKTGN